MKVAYLFLLLLFVGCEKEENEFANYKCVYGINKVTLQRQFIYCVHRELVTAGNNQAAADKISDKLGLPKVNVLVMNNYTNWESANTTNCNCQ